MGDFHKLGVESSHEHQVLNLTLNAPKANVLDSEMMAEIVRAIKSDGINPATKAIVFRGAGEHFSFGASVPEHTKERVAGMLASFHELMRTLIHTGKPMFAVVKGQCLGGGLELAAICHWIFAGDNAMFGQPEIKLAVFPPVASLVLPNRIGQSAADDLVLTGRSITAQRANELGLVHSISDDPDAEVEKYIAQHILPKSAVALQFAVKSSRYAMHKAFLQDIEAVEKLYVHELMSLDDPNEGIQAFIEKRKPIWKNR